MGLLNREPLLQLIDMYCERSRLHGPFCLLASYTTSKQALAYLVSVFERVLIEWQPPDTTEDLEGLR